MVESDMASCFIQFRVYPTLSPSIGWLVGRLSSHAIFASLPLFCLPPEFENRVLCAAAPPAPRLRFPRRQRGREREGERATLPRPPQPPPPDHPPSHASAAPTSQPPKYGPTDHALVVPIPTASLTKGRSAGRPASPADPLLWHTVGAKRNHDDEGPVCGRP